MKKRLLLFICIVFFGGKTFAQPDLNKPFRNYSVGLTFGTTGLGINAATVLNKHLALRAGFSTIPGIRFTSEFDIYNMPQTVDLKAKFNQTNGKVILDYFPFEKSSFFIAAGIYAGTSNLLQIKGSSTQAIEISGQVINPVDGLISFGFATNSVKPYFGVGFGRSVPSKKVGFKFDLGAMYHGTPKIHSSDPLFDDSNINNDDFEDFVKVVHKIKFYPVLNFNIIVKI